MDCRVKLSHGPVRRFIRREDDQKEVENMSKVIDEAVRRVLVRPSEMSFCSDIEKQ
jgi:hypothetical protein